MLLEVTYQSDIAEKLRGLATEFRAARAELLEEAGNRLEQALAKSITASGLQDTHGKIRSWQEQYKGSGGGYVALRPTARDAAGQKVSGANSPGAITNYLESGHKVRFPSGKAKRYRPEVHVARARAFKFYANTQPEVQKVERETAKAMEQRLAAYLEG